MRYRISFDGPSDIPKKASNAIILFNKEAEPLLNPIPYFVGF